MRTIRSKAFLAGFRDFLASLIVFAVLTGSLSGPNPLSLSRAAASDRAVTQAIEATSPAGLRAENAMIAALARPTAPAGLTDRGITLILLGLTISLIVTFNLSIWRHLRRVYASPRQDVWRRGS